jgi:UDP-N-acetylmuramate dehydrogenase
LVTATVSEEIPQAVRELDPALVLAGGSNVVIGDAGVPGNVLLLRTRGFAARVRGDGVTLTVAAGEPWDEVVDRSVAEGWSGIECLSGIPGSAGATPIQNVGAYGQEVADTIHAVRGYDRERDEISWLSPAECRFGYRTSRFKHPHHGQPDAGPGRWIVLDVRFRLRRHATSTPVRYPELARALGVPVGGQAPLAEVRAAVLGLRAGKGMVLDPADPDTYSVGSFFTNPVLGAEAFAALRALAGPELPGYPAPDGSMKTSAAWLIERAGFHKGYGRDGVAISTKHTLALTNRGSGTTAALLELAREIRDGVRKRFEVDLYPEPVLINCAL